MIGFYHSADLDGHCCGAILRRKFGDQIELIGIDYGDPFPWDKVKGKDVIMADFSLQPFEGMQKLKSECNLVWIDHHISAIKEAEKVGMAGLHDLGMLDTTKAACELCWEYLFPEKQMPEIVHLLGRYDVWDLEDPNVLLLQHGMRLQDSGVDSPFWEELFCDCGDLVTQIIEDGSVALKSQKLHNEKYQRACAFKTELDGLKVIACNVGLVNSQAFDCWSEGELMGWDDIQAFCSFYWKKGQWTVSLYSTKVDVSEICKKQGGGGHKGAAGFQCKELPENFLR